ncbi:hypothetical protein [Xylophilus sp. Leaf220]|uniref:hypothetical protein n=1 Tax=Xylophilus sp. Leaf220 TaxID=1735686 RepID=UPI0012E1B9D8|nr:hypothetical protein [Xylophilus sp. Leaf220]
MDHNSIMENFSWPTLIGCLFAAITLALKIAEADVTTWQRLGRWVGRIKWPALTLFVLGGSANSLIGIVAFWLDPSPIARIDVLRLLLHVGVVLLLPKLLLDEVVESRRRRRSTGKNTAR